MVVWTEEMKAKAAATRAAKKAKKEARRAKKLQREASNGSNNTDSERVSLAGETLHSESSVSESDGIDWETIPLAEAQVLAAEMKREYERITQIIIRRQNPPKQMWTCWSVENPELVPSSVKKQCLRHGEDGKWKFRDDGRFVVENGVRRLKPAFCCNFLCYAVYQRNRVTPPAREAQRQP